MTTFKKLFFLISHKDHKQLILILAMTTMMALLDMIGVASILPFVAILSSPDLIETNTILSAMFKISKMFGIENYKEFTFLLGVLTFFFLIISLTFKAFVTYLQIRFVEMCEFSIGKRLITGYLYKPYSWFLSIHSADLGKNILSEVGTLVGSGINSLINLFVRSVAAIALIILLFIVDPKLVLIIGFSFCFAYLLIFFFINTFLSRIGKLRLKNNKARYAVVSESFAAAKELKLKGLEEVYIKKFSNAAQVIVNTQSSINIVSQLPRYILEAIAFGGILLIILYIISQKGNFNNAIPIISLYALAGYRLLPTIQGIYSSFTLIAYIRPTLDKIYNDLNDFKSHIKNKNHDFLFFNKSIILNNIYFNYPNSSQTSLQNISLSIPAKSIVGIVGTTGSGKTTLVDIILGLLEPQKGTLAVDGKLITKQNIRSWQDLIGYVPQHTFLIDNSISANIALGESDKDINQDLVEKVSKIANLHQFVVNQLPDKYQTYIGERGIRLSGGQRQRIAIARALYYNPKVLILDEATNALDNVTEKKVIEDIYKLSNEITIIIITHRLNVIKNCDIIYKLNEGKHIEQISYNEIANIKF